MPFLNPIHRARETYPAPWTDHRGSQWRYYDAVAASGNQAAHEGMLVLREDRQGCEEPKYHWKNIIPKSELQQTGEPMTQKRLHTLSFALHEADKARCQIDGRQVEATDHRNGQYSATINDQTGDLRNPYNTLADLEFDLGWVLPTYIEKMRIWEPVETEEAPA